MTRSAARIGLELHQMTADTVKQIAAERDALRSTVEELTELLARFDQFASEHSYSPDNIIVPDDEYDVEGLIFAGHEEVKLWRDVRAALARAKRGD